MFQNKCESAKPDKTFSKKHSFFICTHEKYAESGKIGARVYAS